MPKLTPAPGSLTALDVGRTAPDNTGRPAITGYDVSYRESGETDWLGGPQDVFGNSAANKDGDSPWSDAGKGATPRVRFAESPYGVSEGESVPVKVILSPAASTDVTVR